jgi:hypothetical protein
MISGNPCQASLGHSTIVTVSGNGSPLKLRVHA